MNKLLRDMLRHSAMWASAWLCLWWMATGPWSASLMVGAAACIYLGALFAATRTYREWTQP